MPRHVVPYAVGHPDLDRDAWERIPLASYIVMGISDFVYAAAHSPSFDEASQVERVCVSVFMFDWRVRAGVPHPAKA
jgi:hypothetical protein